MTPSAHRLFLVFAAGLALACLAFWMGRDFSVPALRDIVEQDASRVAPPLQVHEKAVHPGGHPAEIKEKPVLPRVEERLLQLAGESGRELANTVVRSLTALQSLPFPQTSGDVIPGTPGGMEDPPPGMIMPRLRTTDKEPKLAIVIDDLGFSKSAVRELLDLDYPVALAFLPHGAHTQSGAREAHAKGREILVHQPMEPVDYPQVRPGPNALLAGMSDSRIRHILNASIAAVPHAVGLNNHMGSRFAQQINEVNAVIQVLKERDLFMLDSLTHRDSVFVSQSRRMGVKYYSRDVFLDSSPSREKILEELYRAERIALLTGQAVAIGHPFPETLAALKDWQHLRNREVRIVKLRELRQDRE